MSERKFLGMLTPSSNTALEPICAAVLAGVPNVSAHFARFRVTEISLKSAALSQFGLEPMLQAASLLADARVNSICWNGTSAGWLGFEQDRALCRAIKDRTGISATSSVLALEEIFSHGAVKRFGMVSPYLQDVQDQIIAKFHDEGFDCIAERHLEISENFAFSQVPAATLGDMVRHVASSRPDAIMIFCTNLRSAPLVEALERELGIPIYDSTAAAIWGALRIAGIPPASVSGWGSVFRELS